MSPCQRQNVQCLHDTKKRLDIFMREKRSVLYDTKVYLKNLLKFLLVYINNTSRQLSITYISHLNEKINTTIEFKEN
jgi:hypothetical protein